MDEVARLQPVSEHDGPLPGEEPRGEPGDGGGILALRVLPRPVDVEEPQCHARQAVRARIRLGVQLAGDLLRRVRAHRAGDQVLVLRLLGTVAVRRARAGQHHPADGRRPGGLQHVDGPADVHGIGPLRFRHGQGRRGNGCEMKHPGGPLHGPSRRLAIGDGAFDERELRMFREQRRRVPLAAGEIVEPHHVVPFAKQGLGEMPADEARHAGHAHLRHQRSPPASAWQRVSPSERRCRRVRTPVFPPAWSACRKCIRWRPASPGRVARLRSESKKPSPAA